MYELPKPVKFKVRQKTVYALGVQKVNFFPDLSMIEKDYFSEQFRVSHILKSSPKTPCS